MIKEWPDSHAVSPKKQCLTIFVPKGQGKLTVEIIKQFHTLFFVEMDQNLSIGMRIKTMAAGF